MVDIDDTIIEVHGYSKRGSGYGYSGVRRLNALLATVSTSQSAPVIVAHRLRKGSCGSPRGAARLVADALKTVASLSSTKALVRADSAFYGHAAVRAPATREVTFSPAFAPLSVGTLRCVRASSSRPTVRANASTGTNPADDTRFGSSNTAEVARDVWQSCIYEMPFVMVEIVP